MEREVMSKHLRTERIDRAVYIATTIGIGKEVIRKLNKRIRTAPMSNFLFFKLLSPFAESIRTML